MVLAESDRRFIDRLSDLRPDGLVEPFVYTRAEVERMLEDRNPFLLDVLRDGLVLFDRGFWAKLRTRFEILLARGLVEPLGRGWRIRG